MQLEQLTELEELNGGSLRRGKAVMVKRRRRWRQDLGESCLGGTLTRSDHLGIEVFEGAGFDPARLDECIDVLLLETDDPPKSVSHDLSLVNEPVESTRSDPEILGSAGSTQPLDLGGHEPHSSAFTPFHGCPHPEATKQAKPGHAQQLCPLIVVMGVSDLSAQAVMAIASILHPKALTLGLTLFEGTRHGWLKHSMGLEPDGPPIIQFGELTSSGCPNSIPLGQSPKSALEPGVYMVGGFDHCDDWLLVDTQAVSDGVNVLRRSSSLMVALVDADLDDETNTGSCSIEERSAITRMFANAADLLVCVSGHIPAARGFELALETTLSKTYPDTPRAMTRLTRSLAGGDGLNDPALIERILKLLDSPTARCELQIPQPRRIVPGELGFVDLW